MRKLLALFLALGATTYGAESYSVPVSDANQATMTALVDAGNYRTCKRLNAGTAGVCTQAQACTAASAPGGASCTPAQARGASARIFPQTQPGREEFFTFEIAAPKFGDLQGGLAQHGRERMCDFWATANQTQRDALCTGSGQAAGCVLCN